MRPMQLEFPGDPAVDYLDRQYLLGSDLLVAPVFSEAGDVSYYLPAGTWTNLLTDEVVDGPVWRRETHAFDSIPLWVRGGAVLVTGSRDDRPDYDYTDEPLVTVYPGVTGEDRSVTISNPLDGSHLTVTVATDGDQTVVTSDSAAPFRARLAGGTTVVATDRKALLR
jgi:alpha-D-xyloside xylohydrolase